MEKDGCSMDMTPFVASYNLPRFRYELFKAFKSTHIERYNHNKTLNKIITDYVTYQYHFKKYGSMPEHGYTTFILLLPSMEKGSTRINTKQKEAWEEIDRELKFPDGCMVVPFYKENFGVILDAFKTLEPIKQLISSLIVDGFSNPQRIFLIGYAERKISIFQLFHGLSTHIAAGIMISGSTYYNRDLLFFNHTHSRSGFILNIPDFRRNSPIMLNSALGVDIGKNDAILYNDVFSKILDLHKNIKGDVGGAAPALFPNDLYDFRRDVIGQRNDNKLEKHLKDFVDKKIERQNDIEAFIIYVDGSQIAKQFYNVGVSLKLSSTNSYGLLMYYREPSGNIIMRTYYIEDLIIRLNASTQMRYNQSVTIDGVTKIYENIMEKSSTYVAQLGKFCDPFLATGIELRINIPEHTKTKQP